jgi:hypothetical protein
MRVFAEVGLARKDTFQVLMGHSFFTGWCPRFSAISQIVYSGGDDFLYGFKPGRHGPDAPPLAPASARSRSAPRARRAAGARHGSPDVDVCRGRVRKREARIVRSRPPSVKPAARPDPGPSAVGHLTD